MLIHFFTTNIPLLFVLAVIAGLTWFTGDFILYSGYNPRATNKIQNPKKYWNLTYLIGILACIESSYLFYIKLPVALIFCTASMMFWCGSILVDPPSSFMYRKSDDARPITEKRLVGGAWMLTSLVLGIFFIISVLVDVYYHR